MHNLQNAEESLSLDSIKSNSVFHFSWNFETYCVFFLNEFSGDGKWRFREAIFLQFLKWLQINLYFIATKTKWLDFTTFIILVKTDYLISALNRVVDWRHLRYTLQRKQENSPYCQLAPSQLASLSSQVAPPCQTRPTIIGQLAPLSFGQHLFMWNCFIISSHYINWLNDYRKHVTII